MPRASTRWAALSSTNDHCRAVLDFKLSHYRLAASSTPWPRWTARAGRRPASSGFKVYLTHQEVRQIAAGAAAAAVIPEPTISKIVATVAAVLVGVDELGGQRGVTVFGTWLCARAARGAR